MLRNEGNLSNGLDLDGWTGVERKEKMSNRILQNRLWRIPMNIQKFAEGDEAGADEGNGGGSGTEEQGGDDSGGGDGPKPPASFDEWLAANREYQAEFDRRTQKALGTQRERLEVLFSEKATEAEKLAKMTKDEKEQYLRQKKENELAKREADITKRELMAEAKNTLAEKKLPVGLAEVLDYSDADRCNKSIEAVTKAFQEAVSAAVEEKLKGGAPLHKPEQNGDTQLETILNAMDE